MGLAIAYRSRYHLLAGLNDHWMVSFLIDDDPGGKAVGMLNGCRYAI